MTSLLEMSFVLSEDQNGPVKALRIHKHAGLHAHIHLFVHTQMHTRTHTCLHAWTVHTIMHKQAHPRPQKAIQW